MKKLLPFITLVVCFFVLNSKSYATHTAAAQTDVIFNDSNYVPCTFPQKYIPQIKFYRDCSGNNAGPPSSLTLTVQSTCYGSTTYQMDPYSIVTGTDTIGGGKVLLNNCITGDDVACTEEYVFRYYNPDGSFNIDLPGPCKDWTFSWSLCCRPGNNENVQGGSIYAETVINNTMPCDTVVTGANGIPPNDTCINNVTYNNAAVFNDDRPVVTFCVGKKYKYFVGATDPDGDSLAYKIVNPLSGPGTPVGFTPGYSVNDPIPVVNRPVSFDEKNGVLEFTPAQAFTGAFAYEVEEWRDSCYVDSMFVNGDSVAFINTKKVLVGTIMRDTRFIFGDQCVTNLPSFGNDPLDPNAPVDPNLPPLFTDAITINCATREFNVRMNVALQCNTLEPYGTDFRIVSGPVENPTAIFGIDSVWATNCVLNEFTNFTIRLYKPIGPGSYKIFFKTGDDFNTLQTKCGINVPQYTALDLTVVDNFTFSLDFDSIVVCRPADPAPIARANFDDATYYSWSYNGNPIGGDSAQTQVVDSNGVWTVNVNVEGCQDFDDFYVDITQNRPVVVPDFHLCPEEIDTLVVRMDSVPQGSNHTFYWLNDKTGLFEIVSYRDSLIAGSFDRGGTFISEITLNNICVTEDTFQITGDPVFVEIGRDSTICEGDQYWLYNMKTSSYKVPEQNTYQWYFNGFPLSGATNDSLFISDKGTYRLEVTRRNLCSQSDSVFINVTDTLATPGVACQQITFENGQIRQRFIWDVIEGADDYEVQEIYENGNRSAWLKPNDLYGIHHFVFGAQAKLIVRALNHEVDSLAACKYSAIGQGESCEAVVKPTNVFTPNGDGVNDFLSFDLIQVYPGSKLQIFNRWGKMIYEDNDYSNTWNGEDYKAGTYYYVLDINDPTQGIQKGYFTIIR